MRLLLEESFREMVKKIMANEDFWLVPWAGDDEFMMRSRWRRRVEKVKMMGLMIAIDDEFIYDDDGSWDEGCSGGEGEMEGMPVSHGILCGC